MISGSDSFQTNTGAGTTEKLPESVMRWKEQVTKEAEKNGISNAVPYLLGIMMVETGGNSEKYPDIFQCSESQGRPPNSIKSPQESIEVGVRYFADMYKAHGGYDVLTIVQAYNFGGGYLETSGSSYSLEKAIEFSKKKANGQKVNYTNSIATGLGYDFRYSYGNMFYSQLVKQYVGNGTNGGDYSGNNQLVKSALKELSEGNHQGGEKYWRWYGFNSRVEWCAIFVSYVSEQVNGGLERFAYCPTGIANFKAKNQWFPRGIEPKSGMIIFFDWDGDHVSDHVGIVESYQDGVVYTIEGNSGDVIARRSYGKDDEVVMGYGNIELG